MAKNHERLLARIAQRWNDEVMQIIYDMNPDLYRESYLVPMRKRHAKFFARTSRRRRPSKYLSWMEGNFSIRRAYMVRGKGDSNVLRGDRAWSISFAAGGEFREFAENIFKIRTRVDREEDSEVRKEIISRDEKFISWLESERGEVAPFKIGSNGVEFGILKKGVIRLFDEESKRKFVLTYMYEWLEENFDHVVSTVSDERSRYKRVTSSLEEFFSS